MEATKDPTVKMAMADKLDPFWIGAYAAAIEICEQYLEQALEGWHGVTPDAKEKIKQAFMVRYKAHGYPIDCKILTEIGVPHVMADEDAEQVLGDLHENCVDLLPTGSKAPEGLIILTKGNYFFRLGDFTNSGRVSGQPTTATLPTVAAQAASSSARRKEK